MKDDKANEWTHTLKDDLVRINRFIEKQRCEIDEGIDKLRSLETERRVIVDKCLGECDGKS